MHIVIMLALAGLLIACSVWLVRWQYRTADAQLDEWAKRVHVRVLEKERANTYGTGPQAMRGSSKQIMYRVTVEDAQGARIRPLIKVGSGAMGALADDFLVEWEDGGTYASSPLATSTT